jgi:WD40 repeat protein
VPPQYRKEGSPWSLSPDGKLLAVTQENRIGLYDMQARTSLFATNLFASPPEVVGRVDDRLYIHGGGRLRVFQLPHGGAGDAAPRELPSPVPPDETVGSASLSPSAHKLALLTYKASSRATSKPSERPAILSILDLRDGRRMEIADQEDNKVGRLELDPFPGHNNLLVAGWRGEVSIYDSQSGQPRYHFACHSRCFGFLGSQGSPMDLVAAGSGSDGLVLYSTRCGMAPYSINRLFWDGSTLAVSPSQKSLAVETFSGWRGGVCIWEAQAVKQFLEGPQSGHPGPVKRIDLSGQPLAAMAWLEVGDSESRFLVTAQGGRNDLVIWDVRSGKPLTRLVGHQAPVVSMHCDGNGLLYSVSSDTALIAWDAAKLLEWCNGNVK